VKEFLKLVNIWQSYGQEYAVVFVSHGTVWTVHSLRPDHLRLSLLAWLRLPCQWINLQSIVYDVYWYLAAI